MEGASVTTLYRNLRDAKRVTMKMKNKKFQEQLAQMQKEEKKNLKDSLLRTDIEHIETIFDE
jgi:hypothetical protein